MKSICDGLETSLGTERAGFHLRELILGVRRETGRIEGALRELKYPNIFTVCFVRLGFRHEGSVDRRHRREIGKPAGLVNRLGHRGAKKIYVVGKDNHKVNF